MHASTAIAAVYQRVVHVRRQTANPHLVVLHTPSCINEDDIEVMIPRYIEYQPKVSADSSQSWNVSRTICNRFLGNTSCVLPISFLVQLDASFAVCSAIYAEHAQIADMNSQLLNSTTPRSTQNMPADIAGRNLSLINNMAMRRMVSGRTGKYRTPRSEHADHSG